MEKVFRCETLEELPDLAETLLREIKSCIWCFSGELGAGKTTLIKAICEKLGVEDRVSSPTFSIVREYADAGGEPIYHFDFYRIESPEEGLDLGLEEYFEEGVYCFAEWPEKVGGLIPEEAAQLELRHGSTKEERIIILSDYGRTR